MNLPRLFLNLGTGRLLAAAALLLAPSVSAAPFLLGGINQTIPDNNIVGVSSSIHVSLPSGSITDLGVLLQISGGFSGDYYASLSKDGGPGFAVLLNRIGRADPQTGYFGSGINVAFADSAAADIHSSGVNSGLLSGSWQPDGRESDPAVADFSDARTAFLGSFNGMDPSGDWTLFVADMDGGGEGTLVSWGLLITSEFTSQSVPENASTAHLLAGGLLAMVLAARRFRAGAQSAVRNSPAISAN